MFCQSVYCICLSIHVLSVSVLYLSEHPFPETVFFLPSCAGEGELTDSIAGWLEAGEQLGLVPGDERTIEWDDLYTSSWGVLRAQKQFGVSYESSWGVLQKQLGCPTKAVGVSFETRWNFVRVYYKTRKSVLRNS